MYFKNDVTSIAQVIFALEAEMEHLNKMKPRSAKAMCEIQDRYVTLSNAVKYLRRLEASALGA